MWKKVGVVSSSNKNSPILDTKTVHQFTPSSMDKLSHDNSQAGLSETYRNEFCTRYFKSIDKKRFNESRLSSSSQKKIMSNRLFEATADKRRYKLIETQANESMVVSEKNHDQAIILVNTKKSSMSPVHLKELIQQAQQKHFVFPVQKNNKLKQLKKRIRLIKKDFSLAKQSIIKDILLFKSQMNRVQTEALSLELGTSSKQKIQNLPTETSIPSGSPSKSTLKEINEEINLYQKQMNDLQKRKQQLVAQIQQNERKIKA